MVLRRIIRHSFNALDRRLNLRGLVRDGGVDPALLEGDRAIEWSWVISHLGTSRACRVKVLDFGSVQSVITMTAARLGHDVTSVDLRAIEYEYPGVTFRRGDLLRMGLGSGSFDVVVNSSTVEHVGLAGRYGAEGDADGDLQAMRELRRVMKEAGTMLLTIPVGRDAVFEPFHRIYGEERLPRLLAGFQVQKEEFWKKQPGSIWIRCSRGEGLEEVGSASCYGLGLFVLRRSGL